MPPNGTNSESMQSPKKSTSKKKEPGSPGERWSEGELRQFWNGFKLHGTNWKAFVGTKTSLPSRTAAMAESLYQLNKTFLNSDKSSLDMFLSIATDLFNNLEAYPIAAAGTAKTPKSQKQKSTPSSKKRDEESIEPPRKRGKGTSLKRELFPTSTTTTTTTSTPITTPSTPSKIQRTESSKSVKDIDTTPRSKEKSQRKEMFFEEEIQFVPKEATPESHILQEKLEKFLRNDKTRLWCMYEWFYSTLDRGYFNHNEFQEMLNERNLGKITHATRLEWSYFKLSIGNPRRFSPAFLQEERSKLQHYRSAVRAVRDGQAPRKVVDDIVPLREIPPLLTVGDSVLVFHNRDIVRGTISSVRDSSTYGVTFEDDSIEYQVSDEHVMLSTTEKKGPTYFVTVKTAQHPITHNHHYGSSSLSSSSSSIHNNHSGPVPHPPLVAPVQQSRAYTGTVPLSSIPPKPELIGEYLKLLRAKDYILKEVANMNREAEKIADSGGQYAVDFQRDYAWLIVRLEETSRQLEQLHKNQRSDTVTREPLQLPSDQFKPWLTSLSPKCKNAAKKLVEEKVLAGNVGVQKDSNNDSKETTTTTTAPLSPAVSDLISACVSLLLYLSECAEAELSEVEVRLTLQNALAACRPKYESNYGAFRELESTVMNLIKPALVNMQKQSKQ